MERTYAQINDTYLIPRLSAALQHVDTSAKLDKDLSNKVAARLTAFSTFSLFKKLSLEVPCARVQCSVTNAEDRHFG